MSTVMFSVSNCQDSTFLVITLQVQLICVSVQFKKRRYLVVTLTFLVVSFKFPVTGVQLFKNSYKLTMKYITKEGKMFFDPSPPVKQR